MTCLRSHSDISPTFSWCYLLDNFKDLHIHKQGFSCLVPEVWRVQWIWILRVQFVVLFISWGISANSFLLCQNLRRDGCSAQLDYCDSSQHVKRFPCGKPQQREFSSLSFCFYRQRRKSVSSEPTFILSSQTYQANQWQLYIFIILIITSTTVQ